MFLFFYRDYKFHLRGYFQITLLMLFIINIIITYLRFICRLDEIIFEDKTSIRVQIISVLMQMLKDIIVFQQLFYIQSKKSFSIILVF